MGLEVMITGIIVLYAIRYVYFRENMVDCGFISVPLPTLPKDGEFQ